MLPLFGFIMGCTPEKQADTATSPGNNFQPTMPISECGLPEYNFLTTEKMGNILSSSKRDDLSLSQED